jgi:hypothetical protein
MGREREKTHESRDPILSREVIPPGHDVLLVNPCSLGKESVMDTEGRLRVVRVVEGPLGVLIVIRKVVWRAKRAVARGSGSIVLQNAPDVAAPTRTTAVVTRYLHELRTGRTRNRKDQLIGLTGRKLNRFNAKEVE